MKQTKEGNKGWEVGIAHLSRVVGEVFTARTFGQRSEGTDGERTIQS